MCWAGLSGARSLACLHTAYCQLCVASEFLPQWTFWKLKRVGLTAPYKERSGGAAFSSCSGVRCHSITGVGWFDLRWKEGVSEREKRLVALLSVWAPPSTRPGQVTVVTSCGKLFLCDKNTFKTNIETGRKTLNLILM